MSELYSILNKLTPDTPLSSTQKFFEEEKVLLWSNSSSSSAFAAQTISLDLNNYTDIQIVFVQEAPEFFIVGGSSRNSCSVAGVQTSNYSLTRARSITVNTDSIVFGNGTQKYTNQSSVNTDNGCLVPYYIYGIKKIGGGRKSHSIFKCLLYKKNI